MSSEPIKIRMTSVILRAALGVIFIWHGLEKASGPSDDWGAAWANVLWRKEARPPKALSDKLAALPASAWLTAAEAKARLPEAKVEELRTRRLQEAESRIHDAYSAELNAPPDILSPGVQYAVAWGELAGGLALLLGLLTRLAALGMGVVQLGAIYFVTGVMGLTSVEVVGFEYNLALLAMCLGVLVLGGAGWSVDHLLFGRRAGATGSA